MANKNLRWYNYAAKVLVIAVLIPVAPILILIALAVGERPLMLYRTVWNEKASRYND